MKRYGECSPFASVPGDGRDVPVKIVLDGLRPHTIYHYRFVVQGGHGQVADTGLDRTFATPSRGSRLTLDPKDSPTGEADFYAGMCL